MQVKLYFNGNCSARKYSWGMKKPLGSESPSYMYGEKIKPTNFHVKPRNFEIKPTNFPVKPGIFSIVSSIVGRLQVFLLQSRDKIGKEIPCKSVYSGKENLQGLRFQGIFGPPTAQKKTAWTGPRPSFVRRGQVNRVIPRWG